MGGKKLEGSSSNPSSSITSNRLQVEEYDPFGGRSYVIEKLLAPHPPKEFRKEWAPPEVDYWKTSSEPRFHRIGTVDDIIASGIPHLNESEESIEEKCFMFQEKNYPCNLCSSIYYGGRDPVFLPPETKEKEKKKVDENDPEVAPLGNWWQGSFYY